MFLLIVFALLPSDGALARVAGGKECEEGKADAHRIVEGYKAENMDISRELVTLSCDPDKRNEMEMWLIRLQADRLKREKGQ